MALDDLFQAITMFNQGAQQLGVSRGIQAAQDQIAQINSNVTDQIQKRQQLEDVGRNLALNMGKLDAPVSQIQSAVGAVMPNKMVNANEANIEALQHPGPGGENLLALAKQQQKFEEDPKLAALKLQGEYHLEAARQQGAVAAGKLEAKQNAADDKSFEDFNKTMDPNKARSGTWGDLTKQALQTKKLQALFGGPTGFNLTGPMSEEAALSLHRLITGSNSAHVEQVKALLPPTAVANGKAFLQYWNNHPELLNNQDFMKNIAMTAQREGGVVLNQYKDIAYMNAMRRGNLQEKDPDKFKRVIAADPMLNPNEFDQFVSNREQGLAPSYWKPDSADGGNAASPTGAAQQQQGAPSIFNFKVGQ